MSSTRKASTNAFTARFRCTKRIVAKMFANSIGTKKDANPKMPTSKWNPKRQWTPKIFERKAEEFEKQNTLEYTKFKAEVEILLGNETKVPEVNAANVANDDQKEPNLNQKH